MKFLPSLDHLHRASGLPYPHAEGPDMRTGGPHSGNPSAAGLRILAYTLAAVLGLSGVYPASARGAANSRCMSIRGCPGVAVISDVLVGALLAQSGLEGAALNVEVNLAAMTEPGAVERIARDLVRARTGVAERVERILAAGRSRLKKPVGQG